MLNDTVYTMLRHLQESPWAGTYTDTGWMIYEKKNKRNIV